MVTTITGRNVIASSDVGCYKVEHHQRAMFRYEDSLDGTERDIKKMKLAGAAMPEQYKPLTVLHPVSFNASTDPCSTTFSPRPTHATLPSHFPKTPSKSTSPQI
ncbi:hypothetical protein Tco_1293237 [Tanacetum coccineum]